MNRTIRRRDSDKLSAAAAIISLDRRSGADPNHPLYGRPLLRLMRDDGADPAAICRY